MTVVFLGVITSGLSLVALVRLLSTATSQRIERARDNVSEEVHSLAAGSRADHQRLLDAPRAQVIGMRGGYATRPEDIGETTPAPWKPGLEETVRRAGHTHQRASLETPIGEGILVVSAEPATDGSVAWAAYTVRTPPYLDGWRWIVLALSLVTLLLVASAVQAVFTVKSSASALNGALAALAKDLSTPVPRPPVRELRVIADGIAALARNLAQSRQEQERLGRELARQERLAALGRVVAGVAHEVRNPLASIKLRLDLAVTGNPVLPPPVQQAVSHASAEIARLDRLVADLLVVAGRSLGPQHPTALGQLVRERVDALQPWAQLRQVTVSIQGDATVDVDRDSIGRAFDNLLRNAVEASPAGRAVEVTIAVEGSQVKLTVEDSGVGVEGARVAELFEPFFTTKADGTGLGLAISRALARAHGGDVVYARAGDVTRFELTLPRQSAVGERREATA